MWGFLVLLYFGAFGPQLCSAVCSLPSTYQKVLYSIDGGISTYTTIGVSDLIVGTENDQGGSKSGICYSAEYNITYDNAPVTATVIYSDVDNPNCYFCYHFLSRGVNVIQYRYTQLQCVLPDEYLCADLIYNELITGFDTARTQNSDFNCKSIIEGLYQFDYKIRDYTGVCSSQDSLVKACQVQGSPLTDNEIFYMNFGYCPSVRPETGNQATNFRFRCYARWEDADENIWAAVAYDERDERFKYRCLLTRMDQQNDYSEVTQVWGMTIDASCSTMKTYFDAPLRLEMKWTFDEEYQLREMQPSCKLPSNFSGIWFYPGNYNTEVIINSTHIYYKRKLDQYTFEEVYFVCRQHQESRYMMAAVTKGKCYVDFICFHFMPLHHNIIRFRMGRPFRVLENIEDRPSDYLNRMFRESCHWNSFTLNYVDWVYEYWVLNPPLAVNCPVQGRFTFQQIGNANEAYITKIPWGVTPRPRVKVACENYNESDLYACSENPKVLKLDVDRCMRLDQTGRPISEYDVPDNRLTCVGYWMEDTKSYLITYDPEDHVTGHFRCWVYRRIGFHEYLLSRSMAGQCSKLQTSESSDPDSGASLLLQLSENERLFDDCPMRFDDGRDPYANPAEVRVLQSASNRHLSSCCLLLLSIAIMLSIYYF